MKRIVLLAAALSFATASYAQVTDSSVTSSYNGKTGQLSSGGSTTSQFNIAGSRSLTPSFGILDFNFTAATGTVTGLTVTLEQPDPTLTPGSQLDFFVTTSTAATSGLKFATTSGHDYLDSSLYSGGSTLYSLGTSSYTSSNVDQKDTYTFSGLTGAVATYLSSQLHSGSTIRVVVAAQDPSYSDTDALFYGSGATNPAYVPTATLAVQSVPEPASLALLSVSLVGLVLRRRK